MLVNIISYRGKQFRAPPKNIIDKKIYVRDNRTVCAFSKTREFPINTIRSKLGTQEEGILENSNDISKEFPP